MSEHLNPTPDAELSHSLDIAQQRKDQLKAYLQDLFPETFSEGDIDLKRLATALGAEPKGNERYELSWAGKAEARREIQKRTTATLRPDEANSLNWGSTQNLYIEGENLEVLRTLQKAYFGKVKMIYIDPPYNTGNDSFIYPDDYSERLSQYRVRVGETDELGFANKQDMWKKNTKENGQFHSVWLSMMYPRLFLARNLLRQDGVIFIHIDEHEYSNLEILLQEIFGEENVLGTIVWDKRNPKGDAKGISYQHESILAIAKNKLHFLDKCKFVRPKTNADRMLKKAAQLTKKMGISEPMREEYKNWLRGQSNFSAGERAYSLIDEDGNVYQSVSMAWPNKKQAPDDYKIPIPHPKTNKPCPVPPKGWRNPSSTMKELLKNGHILFGEDENTQPRRKYLLKENLNESINSLLYFGGSDDNFLDGLNIPFENPKPVEVSKKIISPLVEADEIILDFFSGSGTTAQAVLELNEEDGGNRQFICVQMPELLEETSEAYQAGYRSIADIGRARIKKVIERMAAKRFEDSRQDKLIHFSEDKPQQVLGFNVFKLSVSNFKQWRTDIDNIEDLLQELEYHIDSARPGSKEGAMVYELLLKLALPLTTPLQQHPMGDDRLFMAYPLEAPPVFMFFGTVSTALTQFILSLPTEKKPAKVLCLNKAFADSQTLTNFSLQLKDASIVLEVL